MVIVSAGGQVVLGREDGIGMIFLVRLSSVSMYTDALHRPWFAAICLGVVITIQTAAPSGWGARPSSGRAEARPAEFSVPGAGPEFWRKMFFAGAPLERQRGP